MQREDRIRIRHLTEAASKAVAYSADKQRADLDDDELLRLALTKLVEIVGEAAKHVGPDARAALPDVPWRAAARMRDRLVHHYFDINLDVCGGPSATTSRRCLPHYHRRRTTDPRAWADPYVVGSAWVRRAVASLDRTSEPHFPTY